MIRTIWYPDNKIFLYITTIEKSLSIAKFDLVFKHEWKVYGQYHVNNTYIHIILSNHSCVNYIFLKHSSKIGCSLRSCNRIGTVSTLHFLAKWCKVGYISYFSSLCMSVDISGPAWHISLHEFIICLSTRGQNLANLSIMAAKTLSAVSQQLTRIFTNVIYSLKAPDMSDMTIPISGPSLHSKAWWVQ